MDSKHIVIIDDLVEVTESLEMMLSCHFDNVKAFNLPEEALDYLKENNEIVDFIICDIKMPKLDGIDLLKEYRTVNKDTPFAFYSGHAEFDPKLEAVKNSLRLDGIITKPSMDIIDKVIQHFES